ncbi:MAG: lipoyl(octanoyl) transferase LipB [Alphaproteobacteria bacterium]|jgi:lipoyl(octanoyl) transferase|nr:lipoyl(octanoyl) transferase LipB [Alphaproteobacteria bacterium]
MQWLHAFEPVPYLDAVSEMDRIVAGVREGTEDEAVWLLEHPPLYTAGTSARTEDLVDARFPVFESGRGGQYTYHGPGQRVGYVILDLNKRQQVPDIKKYVWQLEEWIIRSLAEFDVSGARRAGRVGIWVDLENGQEAKIAALGVRVRHWVTFHGVSINVDPDLSHFSGIVPCGIKDHGVTSLAALGRKVSMQELDIALKRHFSGIFF